MKASRKWHPGNSARRAFTLLELVAVVAVAALLVGLGWPALGGSKASSKAAVCLSNHCRLQQAWAGHAADNQGWLVAANTLLVPSSLRPEWFPAWTDYSSPDGTNPRFLTNGPLFAYGDRDLRIYRCPADLSTQTRMTGRRATPRVRSVSMSQAFGNGEWLDRDYNPFQQRWRVYARDHQVGTPARTWVWADEHPDSLNDGGLGIACTGAESLDEQGQIIDLPSSLHLGAGTFAFADGSTELHRWQGRRIRPAVNYNNNVLLNLPAGDSQPDVVWLAQRTSVRR